MKNGLLLAALQAGLLCSIGAKFSFERASYPHGWMKTTPYDPNLPLRGRYVNLQGLARMGTPKFGADTGNYFPSVPIRLSVKDDQVFAVQANESNNHGRRGVSGDVMLDSPLAFFIPEKAQDPSVLKPGEELWVEVTIPPSGPPRPIRLQKRPQPTN